MLITSAAGTHVGKIRKNNEDNYFLNGIYKTDCSENIRIDESEDQKARNIYAVCDGVGGEDAGELAALLAVEMLPEYESKDILDYIEEANESICNAIRKRDGMRMGTTLALLAIEDRTAEIYNVGAVKGSYKSADDDRCRNAGTVRSQKFKAETYNNPAFRDFSAGVYNKSIYSKKHTGSCR